MGYTGWLMPDGEFFPCEHKEHIEFKNRRSGNDFEGI
jgi:hypothetical protein